jgi:hypothetical protein
VRDPVCTNELFGLIRLHERGVFMSAVCYQCILMEGQNVSRNCGEICDVGFHLLSL